MAAVFVFDRDGDLNVFASLQHAAGWLEAVDVEEDEYQAVFLHDGTVVSVGTSDEMVLLTPTQDRDLRSLDTLLAQYQQRVPTAPRTSAPLDFANQWLHQEWEGRWPERPRWLARRLHGDAPKQAEDDVPR